MRVLITNVPAVYRIDLYEKLGSSDWKMLFYARHSTALKYCTDDRVHSFPSEDVSLASIFFRLVFLRPSVVVCINASLFTLVCGVYSWLFRKRFVIWWAGTELSERNAGFLKRVFRRFVFRFADAFIVYSEHAGSYLSTLGVNEQKITVLGNMTFDPARFRSKVDGERATRTSHPRTLLSVANLVERKNHVFLLQVFAKLRTEFPDLRLVIAGEGPERQRLESMIRDLDLKGVELRGHVHREEMPALFAEADVFVHPAAMDQWPQALNEAMAAGVPVVVSPQSGISLTLFTSGKELLIVQLDTDLYVEAIRSLLLNDIFKSSIISIAQLQVEYLFRKALNLLVEVNAEEKLNEPKQKPM